MKLDEFLLKESRPTQALQYVTKTDEAGQAWAEMTPCEPNYDFLNFVEREGFDPNGPNGPTYYRVAKTDELRYYSVFRRPDTNELVMLITDLEKCS